MKLTVATTFGIFPARGGGQQRIMGLYTALARLGVAVDVVALVDRHQSGGIRRLSPGLRELRVPKSPELDAYEFKLQQRAGVPVTDIAFAQRHDLCPEFGETVAACARDSAAVVASHPFTQPAIAAATGVPLVYESHNVETDLKRTMLEGTALAEELVGAVEAAERASCRESELVMVCARRDAVRLGELFGIDPAAAVLAENGADPDAFAYTPAAVRAQRKVRLGIDGPLAVFLGSWHEPNLVAVRDVVAAAERLPDVRFLVIGSVSIPLADEPMPPNVDLCGVVDDGFVRSVLGLADVALNPMRWGSGTNLKMLDYALAGVPLVASEFGARGLDLEPGTHYVRCDPDQVAAAVAQVRDEDPARTEARARAVHDVVRERFGWPSIARRLREAPRFAALLEGVRA